MYRTLVFYRSEPPSLSPAISVWWPGRVIELLNQMPLEVWGNGNMPEGRYVDFIGACFAVPDIDTNRMEAWNLPLRWERLHEWELAHGTRVFGEPWRAWLFEELTGWEKPPVLIDLDPPYHATQGSEVLCRRVDLRSDRWEPGQPLWVAAERAPEAEPAAAPDRGPR